ncbi:MAG: DNA double-strand break repair nuclease NurA, partial [Aggregatilineales bacterium]
MTLEFHRIVEQVYRMGGMLAHIPNEYRELMQLAVERFNAAGDLDRARQHIAWVRSPDVSGYRGAAPLEGDAAEPVNAIVDAPTEPPQAVIMACDGGQVYPNENALWHYYLINVGLFVYFHGSSHTPIPLTFPQLVFHPSEVHDKYGRVVSNRAVDDRRTLAELNVLSEHVRAYAYPGVPLLALYDNRLMYMPSSDDNAVLMRAFFDAMGAIRDEGALLAGYVDNPFRSKRFLQLLYLLSLETQQDVRDQQAYLARCGDLEGLRDRDFFDYVLKPGQRSAVMVQNSPQNRDFKDRGRDFEIAFFYLKTVSALDETRVVRVDLPMWVARH